MCASKVRKHDISQAKVIFIDVHWFFSLKGAKELVTRCKRWNPSVLIIAGGITATEFPEQLIETIGVDYVLRGDGEIPLPMLVNALMTGGSLANVPNLIGKEVNNLFRVKPYKLTKSDFNENNFYYYFDIVLDNDGIDKLVDYEELAGPEFIIDEMF